MSTIYSISKFGKRVGKSINTLRRWDESGILTAKRHESGHRFYDETDVRKVLNQTEEKDRLVIVYCRVSSYSQKDDLASQVEAMNTYCVNTGQKVDELIKEIGGGMNFKRKLFLKLFSDISSGYVSKLIVAHKDRLCRFGFDFLEDICKRNGCELEVVNQEKLSPEKEMVDDLLSIVHTFSCRLYGLRSYKKKLKESLS